MAETFQKRQRGMRRKEKQLNKKMRKAERAKAGPEEAVDGYNPLDELYRPSEEQDALDRAKNVTLRPEEGSDPTKQAQLPPKVPPTSPPKSAAKSAAKPPANPPAKTDKPD